jgi:hypothetical protein
MQNSRLKLMAVAVAALTSLGSFMSQASAALITFDDSVGEGEPVDPGYQGLNWDNFYFLNGPAAGGGYAAGTVSAGNVVYNTDGYAALASVAGTFDLNSAYLTGAWNADLQLQVVGKRLGITVYDNTYTLSAVTPTLVNFGYLEVDEVYFSSFGGTPYWSGGGGEHFAMDNLMINAVPEPSTYVAGGLLLLPFAASMFRRLRWNRTL